MKLNEVCKDYFNGFKDICICKKNNNKTKCLGLLKILSYFTVLIPLVFAAIYSVVAIHGRVHKKQDVSPSDHKVSEQGKKTLGKNEISNAEDVLNADSATSSKIELSDVLSAYHPAFIPKRNRKNLEAYSQSEDYQRHAKTARIYYNSHQLTKNDALKIIFQREPTNIAMGNNQYDKAKLKELFGYEQGIYNNASATKTDGSSFRDLPNTAAVYSEVYLWNPPGGKEKKEVACLSLPAPALDSGDQPHYNYYMEAGELNAEKYEQEMKILFACVEKAIRDNKDTAFDNQGIQRVVLSKFGQGAFLGALSKPNRQIANQAYKTQMLLFLDRVKDTGLEVVMSEYSHPGADIWYDKMIIGDIIATASEHDLIINAWDPHSAPGNGNDADHSFDGAMGKASSVILTQTGWLNQTLKSKNSLVAI